MSKENVEFIRGLFAGTGSIGKEALLEALPDLIPQICDPEVEFIETPERVDARIYHGHEGVLACWRRWLDQWEQYTFEPMSFEDHDDVVFVTAREEGRGATSGAPAEALLYLLFSMRGGKILRYEEFYDESSAREALTVAAARPA